MVQSIVALYLFFYSHHKYMGEEFDQKGEKFIFINNECCVNLFYTFSIQILLNDKIYIYVGTFIVRLILCDVLIIVRSSRTYGGR